MENNTQAPTTSESQLQNLAFFKERWRTQLRISAGLLIVVVILSMIIGWLITNPRKNEYFASTRDGKIINLIPLSRPYHSSDAIIQWAADTARKSFNVDFVNWREQISSLEAYFTKDGYESFLSALDASGNIEAIQQKRLIGNAIAQASIIIAEGEYNGRYQWQVEIPLQVTYSSSAESITQSLIIQTTIVRVNTIVNAHGLAIDQFLTRQQ